MARAIWTGEIIFGRVRIPARLETVVSDKSIHSHMVHRKDHGRLQMKRFCTKCKQEVDWGDTSRAVDVGNREVVDFEPEELKGLKVERANEVALAGFADAAVVDPVYYDRTYAFVPVGKQPRAFELLAALLRENKKIAITRANFSGKSYPAVIRVRGAELVLQTLHYGDEVREAKEKPPAQLRPSARELTLASQLVERMTMPFDPTSTEDPYRRAVEEIAAGRKPRPIDEDAARRKRVEEDSEVLDLMSALQRSLTDKPDQGRKATAKAARTASAPKAPKGKSKVETSADDDAGAKDGAEPAVAAGHGDGGGKATRLAKTEASAAPPKKRAAHG
jgi:DNA end-binding protein Ku